MVNHRTNNILKRKEKQTTFFCCSLSVHVFLILKKPNKIRRLLCCWQVPIMQIKSKANGLEKYLLFFFFYLKT